MVYNSTLHSFWLWKIPITFLCMLPNLFTKLLRCCIWTRTVQGIFVFHWNKRTCWFQLGLLGLCCPPCSFCLYRSICFLFFSKDFYRKIIYIRKLFTDYGFYSCCFYDSCWDIICIPVFFLWTDQREKPCIIALYYICIFNLVIHSSNIFNFPLFSWASY